MPGRDTVKELIDLITKQIDKIDDEVRTINGWRTNVDPYQKLFSREQNLRMRTALTPLMKRKGYVTFTFGIRGAGKRKHFFLAGIKKSAPEEK